MSDKTNSPSRDDILKRDPGLARRLLERQVTSLLVVLTIVLPLSLVRVLDSGFNWANAIQWLFFLAFLGVFFWRRRLSPKVLGAIVTITTVAVILAGVTRNGVFAGAHSAVPFVAILASMLFGRKAALWCFGLTCAALASIAALYHGGTLHYQLDVRTYTQSWTVWFVLLSVQATAGLWYLFLIVPINEAERRATERLEAILEGINDALFIHDIKSSAILQVNQKMCAMWGCTSEEALQLDVGDLSAGVPPYSREDAQAWMAKAATLGPQLFEWQAKDIRGALFWVEISMRKALLGGTERLLVTARDISQRRHLEEQLRQAQKMEAIGNLAGGVAHDFNNLLGVILNCTEFTLEALGEDHSLRGDLVEIEKAARRAAALTRQLLAFSRKQVMQPVPLNLNESSRVIEKMLRRILGEDIELALKLAPELGLVMADPGQIEQVLLNLVVNARDAMPKGGKLLLETTNVKLEETLASEHDELSPGHYVQLAVTDNGCGMDAKTKAKIFEPFFTTKARGKGTGLGLSTVYGIVKQSGGAIWIYSEIDHGTTFKIFLPEVRSAAPAVKELRLTVPKQSLRNETILLVEDDDALRRVTQRTLEAVGYKVLVAEDGNVALPVSATYADEIHLLLTDVVMPGMSGKLLAERLSLTRNTMKVLYMSGYTDDAIVHHGVLDPGLQFLSKPFTAVQLTQKVEEVLNGKRERGS